MTKKPRASGGWASIRSAVNGNEKAQLMALVKDLYDLSPENRSFLEARFKPAAGVDAYKDAIDAALYPDVYHNQVVQLAQGRKAIAQYRNASGDIEGTLELMTFYVERGTQFTVDFGDIDEAFYNSVEGMFRDVVDLLKDKGSELADRFVPRLAAVRDSAKGIGWGFYDGLYEALAEAFPEA